MGIPEAGRPGRAVISSRGALLNFEGGMYGLKRHSQYYSFISVKWGKNKIVFITPIYKLPKLSLTKPSRPLGRTRRESRADQMFCFVFNERRNNSESRAVTSLVREDES